MSVMYKLKAAYCMHIKQSASLSVPVQSHISRCRQSVHPLLMVPLNLVC